MLFRINLFCIVVILMNNKIKVSCTINLIPSFNKSIVIFNVAQKMINALDDSDKSLTVINIDLLEDLNELHYEVPFEIFSQSASQNVKVLNQPCETIFDYSKTAMMIILRKGAQDLSSLIDKYYKWRQFTHGTLAIIFLSDVTVENRYYLYDLSILFYQLSMKNLISVVVIIWSNTYKTPNWFTFNFFTGKLFNETGRYDFQKLYYENTKNFQGIKMKLCILHHPPFVEFDEKNNEIRGPEINLYLTLTKFLNINNRPVKPQSVKISSVMASLNYANNNSCDIIFTKTASFYVPGMANMSYPYFLDHYCILVPKAKEIVGIFKGVTPLQISVWYAIIITISLINFYWCIISYLKFPWCSNDSVHIGNIDLFRTFLNMPLNTDPSPMALSSKILIFSAILYGIAIVYIYQSVLYGYLIQPQFEKELNSYEDIQNFGLKIFVRKSELRLGKYFLNSISYDKNLVDFSSSITFESLIEEYKHTFKYGYMLRKTLSQSYLTKHGSDLHLTKNCLIDVMYSYKVACNFPYTMRFQQVLIRLEESGIVKFWDKAFEEKQIDSKFVQNESENVVIRFGDLAGAFILWCSGTLISSIVFCFEHFFKKKYK